MDLEKRSCLHSPSTFISFVVSMTVTLPLAVVGETFVPVSDSSPGDVSTIEQRIRKKIGHQAH